MHSVTDEEMGYRSVSPDEWNSGKQARAETLRLRLWLEKIVEDGESEFYADYALKGWSVEDLLENRIRYINGEASYKV